MAISYTDNLDFPLLDDGAGNSGSVLNGILIDIDEQFGQCIYEDEFVFYDNEIVLK